MKIAIMSDCEGVAGVINSTDWIHPDSKYYEQTKVLLTEEVNAAIRGLYDAALEAAETGRARNNVRLMRTVFRYSDLEVTNPKLDIPGYSEISKSADETGAMWFLNENFGSYLIGNEGYGIAFAVEKRSDAVFQPDHWYAFE